MRTLRLLNPRFVLLFLLIGMVPSVAWGQSSALYNLEWYSIDAGSGQAQGGNYQMNHTVGQPDAFLHQNGSYEVYGGFWGFTIQGITDTPTPTATATGTPTSTATSTRTATPTITRTFTPTSTATRTVTPTATPTVPIPTSTSTTTPTATGTVTPTVTSTITQTATATRTATRTSTPSPSVTPTPTCIAHYDLNRDGIVDAGDLLLLLSYIRNNDLQGDFNCDGKTDYLDLLLFSRQWHQ